MFTREQLRTWEILEIRKQHVRDNYDLLVTEIQIINHPFPILFCVYRMFYDGYVFGDQMLSCWSASTEEVSYTLQWPLLGQAGPEEDHPRRTLSFLQ